MGERAETRFVPPTGAFSIIRDAGGVPGLLLATEVFSEAAEHVFFETTAHCSGSETSRTGEFAASPSEMPRAMFMVLVRGVEVACEVLQPALYVSQLPTHPERHPRQRPHATVYGPRLRCVVAWCV